MYRKVPLNLKKKIVNFKNLFFEKKNKNKITFDKLILENQR